MKYAPAYSQKKIIFFEIQLAMLKDRAWLILKTIGQSGTFAS
jgi:hypothetical protein